MVRSNETFSLRKQFSNSYYSNACVLSLGQDWINSGFPFSGSSQDVVKFSFLPLAFLAIRSMSLIRTQCPFSLLFSVPCFGLEGIKWWAGQCLRTSSQKNMHIQCICTYIYIYIYLIFHWYKGCFTQVADSLTYSISYHKSPIANWSS